MLNQCSAAAAPNYHNQEAQDNRHLLSQSGDSESGGSGRTFPGLLRFQELHVKAPSSNSHSFSVVTRCLLSVCVSVSPLW